MPREKKAAGIASGLDAALALEARSEVLSQSSQHNAAIALAAQALEMRQRLFGKGHAQLIDGLRTLGYALYLADRNEEALPLLGEAVRILDALAGPTDSRLFVDTYVLAQLLQATDRQDSAWPCFARWVALTLASPEVTDEKLPPVVEGLVRHYMATSQAREALDLLDAAMPALTAMLEEASPGYCRVLSHHAVVLEACGQYARGSKVAQRLCAIAASAFGERSAAYLSALARLASLRRALRDHAGVAEVAQHIVDLCADARDVEADLLPTTLWNLAESEFASGRIDLAESYFRRAIALCRALPDGGGTLACALNGLATLHAQTGHLAEAADALQEAATLYASEFGDSSLQCGQALGELGAVYRAAGDLAAADRWMGESVAIIREAMGEAHPAFARALHDHAVIRRQQGATDEARAMLVHSTALLEAALGPDHLLVANHLQGLGDMNRAEGRYAEAEGQLTRALAMMRAVLQPGHEYLRTTLRSLAGVYVAAGRIDEAIALTQQELDGELEMTCQLFALSAEEERLRLLASGTALDVLLTLILRHRVAEVGAVRAAFDQVLRRKGMGAEALAAQRESVLAGRHPELAGALEALRELRERLAVASLAGPGAEGADAHTSLLAEWTAQRTRMEIDLGRAIPDLALAARLRRADVASVAQALPAGSVLVDIVQFVPADLGTGKRDPARLLAFVLRAKGDDDVQLVDLGEAEPIARDLALFRDSVTGQADLRAINLVVRKPKADVQAGDRLYNAVLAPLRAALGGSRRLFVSPDGALNRLPFEILPLGDGRRLIDEYTVSYLGAARDVLRFGHASAVGGAEPLVVADPDFELSVTAASWHPSTGLSFARLPATRIEGELVAGLLGARTRFGVEAVERAVKGSGSPRVLHIATHGYFLPESETSSAPAGVPGRLQDRLANPMLRSGLAFAGANTWLANGALPPKAQDALFTAEDVSGLDLGATDLVVLSACETGLGEVQAGEGVFGLRRAFVLAGARTLVISLWQVPDQQTQELMVAFYRGVLAGASRVDALRQAQLALKERFPEPLFWGAFICLGESGPLAMP